MRIFAIVIFLKLFFGVAFCGENFYELLGLNKDADNRDIRRAFKKLAIEFHPDKNKDDPEAHDKFVKINRAYEVLKDEELRKKYDLYGEDGVKDGMNQGGGQNYQSWHFYKEQFGIYDEDSEIITIGGGEFEQLVMNSGQRWFVNFYSTHCSHCHELAPAWRSMARELDGVIRIGAVNCLDDFMLCQQQGIFGYPSLIMYPEKDVYNGVRSTEALVKYVMDQVHSTVVRLHSDNFEFVMDTSDIGSKPWLIDFYTDSEQTLSALSRKKLSAILENLVNVAYVDCAMESQLCEKVGFDSSLVYFQPGKVDKENGVVIPSLDSKEISGLVLEMLPDTEELDEISFKKLIDRITSGSTKPWLIEFVGVESSKDLELRKLPSLLGESDIKVGRVNCTKLRTLCADELHILKHPTFAVFKSSGGFEIYYGGRHTAYDLASFARDCASSNVRVLGPDVFPNKVMSGTGIWFVDFFAPWCPPCMRLLPEFRKASKILGSEIQFGTMDCTVHQELCRMVNVFSYPTTILYNGTVPHIFVGLHSSQELVDFVEDVKNPIIISMDEERFNNEVMKRPKGQIWVIDFFNPHCQPCQQLAPEFRKLAKLMLEYDFIHFAEVDCVKHGVLCQQQYIQGYPTVRLYPMTQSGHTDYQSWFRDAMSIRQWIHYWLPSKVTELKDTEFFDILTSQTPWLVDFYAPWCGHCQIFAPEFEKVAEKFEGKLKAGKINCDIHMGACQAAGIRGYPSVKFYSGSKVGGSKQSAFGVDIRSQDSKEINRIVEQLLPEEMHIQRDEL